MTIQIELESLRKETDISSRERREKLEETLKSKQEEVKGLMEKWEKERGDLQELKNIKEELERARLELEQAQRAGDFGKAGELRYSKIPALEERLPKDEEAVRGSDSLLHDSVTADDIAAVVAKSTGIPVSKLMRGESERLIHMEDALRQHVRGQDEALAAVSNAIRMQRAGLSGENRPIASFLMLGPTGEFDIWFLFLFFPCFNFLHT